MCNRERFHDLRSAYACERYYDRRMGTGAKRRAKNLEIKTGLRAGLSPKTVITVAMCFRITSEDAGDD